MGGKTRPGSHRPRALFLPFVGGLDKLFHDGQTDSGTAILPGTEFLSTVEALEDKGEILLFQLSGRISKGHPYLLRPLCDRDSEAATFWGVLPGVLAPPALRFY